MFIISSEKVFPVVGFGGARVGLVVNSRNHRSGPPHHGTWKTIESGIVTRQGIDSVSPAVIAVA